MNKKREGEILPINRAFEEGECCYYSLYYFFYGGKKELNTSIHYLQVYQFQIICG